VVNTSDIEARGATLVRRIPGLPAERQWLHGCAEAGAEPAAGRGRL